MKMKPTYVLHPGVIKSHHDGLLHYINATRLAELYGVKIDECTIAPEPRPFDRAVTWRRDPYEGLVHLYPRNDGNYALPTS
jgi:hypothetical protein